MGKSLTIAYGHSLCDTFTHEGYGLLLLKFGVVT